MSDELFEVGVKPNLDAEAQPQGDDEIPKCGKLLNGEIATGNQTYHAEIDDEQQDKCEGAALERFDERHLNLMRLPMLNAASSFPHWRPMGAVQPNELARCG